jgi:uncharacterized protein YuzE
MKIEYDREVDALYIRIQEKEVSRTRELDIFIISTENLIPEATEG